MKFALPIASSYVPDWTGADGIREFIQNGLDGRQDGHELKVTHSGDTLRVTNVGVKLPTKAWLLGESGKRSGDYRGQHGEGMKTGALALRRAGHTVKIVNGDESWTIELEPSEEFGGADVLTVYTHKRQKDSGVFSVEIGGVTKETWSLVQERFLFLKPANEVVETYNATVLLDPERRGHVFVKGIWVQFLDNLAAGYDFKHVTTDRDRRLVNSWDLRYHAGRAWEEAVTQRRVKPEVVVDMLSASSPDVQDLSSSYSSNDEVVNQLAAVFKERHGETAIPVASMAEAREIEHYGRRGVVVAQSLVDVLRKDKAMHLDSVRTEAKNAVKARYSWSDLTVEEQQVYSKVVGLVEDAAKELGFGTVEDRLTVVDFGDDKLDGLFKGGAIQIAKRLLADEEELLATVVHEVAHAAGGDGSVGHERAEGKLFARIISKLTRIN